MKKLVAQVEMLIRRPPREVFDAFAKPRTIERFWLKKASGLLAKGAAVKWDFMVEGASETVKVTAFDRNERIAFDWLKPGSPATWCATRPFSSVHRKLRDLFIEARATARLRP